MSDFSSISGFALESIGRQEVPSEGWFPFSHEEWGRLRSLSYSQRGVFDEIRYCMWTHGGSLPDDDRYMARSLRISALVWRQVKATLVVLRLLEIQDRRLFNSRILQNCEHSRRKSATASRNAQARWSKRRDGNSSQGTRQDGRIPLYEEHGEYADEMRAQANSDTYNLEDL